tara:strand:- start:3025 stop:3399 length:375 start_codon:yes stop_codon:yes gene_type:complete
MEFFIRKDSLEPVLKMQLIQDGRNDFRKFYQGLENAVLSFSMKKVDTGEYVILNKAAGIVQKTQVDPINDPEYYIYYRWQPTDVMEVGRYQGQFLIEFLTDGTQLVAPVREDLYINIQESFGII